MKQYFLIIRRNNLGKNRVTTSAPLTISEADSHETLATLSSRRPLIQPLAPLRAVPQTSSHHFLPEPEGMSAVRRVACTTHHPNQDTMKVREDPVTNYNMATGRRCSYPGKTGMDNHSLSKRIPSLKQWGLGNVYQTHLHLQEIAILHEVLRENTLSFS